MKVAWLFVIAATGCRAIFGIDDPRLRDAGSDAIATDTAVHDSSADAPRGCYGDGALMVCLGTIPSGALTLPGTIDTTNSSLCGAVPASWTAAGQPSACFVAAGMIGIDGGVRVTGARPLVLVADQSITIGAAGVLEASSLRGNGIGPGANPASCDAGTAAGASATGGAGGGGGSLLTSGGNGGIGNGGIAAAGTAGMRLPAAPTVLAGGCPGTHGGAGNAMTTNYGDGGAGGGAVYLVTGGTLTISGIINASGAGATAGGLFSGGGGGGSGGMIVLYAATIQASGARIVANGGGGSAGGDSASNGAPGLDPEPTSPGQNAQGGNGGGGAPGGRGATSLMNGGQGNNGASGNGGGGGGGGVGYLRANVGLSGASTSPPVQVVP